LFPARFNEEQEFFANEVARRPGLQTVP
jgi:hypothetical protein